MHATHMVTSERVRTNLNPMLKNFIAVGQYTPKGRCCFHIDPTLFAVSLMTQKKKVLSDVNFVSQVYAASRGERNGITT